MKLPIITYHNIDELGTRISTSRKRFENQMAWLARNNWKSIKLVEAAQIICNNQQLPEKCVVIAFDDAMPSIRDIATPILREHGLTATAFVITNQAGKLPNWYRLLEPYRDIALLSPDELCKMQDDGWEMLPHTHDHPVLSHLPLDLQVEQIGKSKDIIRTWFGGTGDVLAYPYGQYNSQTLQAMAQCDMLAGLTLKFSVHMDKNNPYIWPRIGSAWFKDSAFRQHLAMLGILERYVWLRGRLKGDRSVHYTSPTQETTRGLIEDIGN